MPDDVFWIFNIVWILLRLFVRFILGGSSLIIGVVIGAVVFEFWGFFPFWISTPFLVFSIMTKKLYPILFMAGVLLGLLGGIIH